jgi:hypothetical protein
VDQDSQQSAPNAAMPAAEASAVLPAGSIDDFLQIAGTIDLTSDTNGLYINGELVDEVMAAEGLTAFSGGNAAALGSSTGVDTNIGGTDDLGGGVFTLDGFGTFDGLISIFRQYDEALTADQILANYQSQLQAQVVPEPYSLAIWSLLGIALTGWGYYRVRRKQ